MLCFAAYFLVVKHTTNLNGIAFGRRDNAFCKCKGTLKVVKFWRCDIFLVIAYKRTAISAIKKEVMT